jgi:hypothetical protein
LVRNDTESKLAARFIIALRAACTAGSTVPPGVAEGVPCVDCAAVLLD